jgi:hypothetical protein
MALLFAIETGKALPHLVENQETRKKETESIPQSPGWTVITVHLLCVENNADRLDIESIK